MNDNKIRKKIKNENITFPQFSSGEGCNIHLFTVTKNF